MTVLLNEAARKILAEKIKLVVANPAQRMKLMPVPSPDVFWWFRLEVTFDVPPEGAMNLLPKSECNVYANLELGADVLGEGGVQGLKDGLGEGILHLSGSTTVRGAAVEDEAVSGLGDGELDLDHGSGSVAQEPAAGN